MNVDEDATRQGMSPLTHPITIATDQYIIDSIVASMKAGGIRYEVRRVTRASVEIWRWGMIETNNITSVRRRNRRHKRKYKI